MIMPRNLARTVGWIFRPAADDSTVSTTKMLRGQTAAGVDNFYVDITGNITAHNLTLTGSFTRTTDDFASGLTVATNAAAFSSAGALRIGTAGASNFTVSAAGVVVVGSTLGVTGLTTLTGGLSIGGGAFTVATTTGIVTTTALINANGGIAVNTNKFTVATSTGDLNIGPNNFTVTAATGNTAIVGTCVHTGLVTANGGVATTAISMTGILSGALHTVVLASSGTVNLTAAQSGAICANQGTSGTTTFNLPSAAAGMKFKFVEAGNAAGELRIVPAAGDDIIGKTDASDTGTGIATSVGAGIKNTAATNVKGDFCILMAINDTDWVMVGEGGVWAAI